MATEPQFKKTANADGTCTEGHAGQDPCFPPVSFTTFILSLAHSAMVLMGEVPSPETGELINDLPEAKHTIDILAMLDCKTRGNRTDEESEVLSSILCELRLAFVKKQ